MQIKEFSRAHYKEQKMSIATVDSICVNNGLRCEMYDTKLGDRTSAFLGTSDIRSKCTFELPKGRYRTLQHYIEGTTHSSNEVLASQCQCPDGLTQHEFYSFGSLRAGHRLQWRNIARELVEQTLNFNHSEISLLVCQSIWQIGPSISSSTLRESHADLTEFDFAQSLLSALNAALSRVESNVSDISRPFFSLNVSPSTLSLSTLGKS
jgi:hypothetical protein